MSISINYRNLKKLQKSLENKLETGCQKGAEILRNNTPIDTRRLWESTRTESLTTVGLISECRIVAGGQSLYGVIREIEIKKDVDYAIFVEGRTNYARESLNDIKTVILESLEN